MVDADDKKAARLNLMAHLLSLLPYTRPDMEQIELPKRQERSYERPPMESQTFVPQRYVIGAAGKKDKSRGAKTRSKAPDAGAPPPA